MLACPECGGTLESQPDELAGREIVSGSLICQGCGRRFPVRLGVPRFVAGSLLPEGQSQTARAFGWEWHRFVRLNERGVTKQQFINWVAPMDPKQFAGRTVLDAGCGMGRWVEMAADFGAAEVVGVDISDAIDVAQARFGHLPNVHFVQADVNRLPFRRDAEAPFDVGYSIGVIHHLPDPEAGFASMVRAVRPNGSVFIWVYGRENNEWVVRFVDPLRKHLFSRLPLGVLYGLTLVGAAFLHLFLKLLVRPLEGCQVAGRLPYFVYLAWLSRYGFRHTHHVLFDHLAAPTAFYISREQVEAWFARARLANVRMAWRNRNSWGVLGLRPSP